jgi:hypothetical protein
MLCLCVSLSFVPKASSPTNLNTFKLWTILLAKAHHELENEVSTIYHLSGWFGLMFLLECETFLSGLGKLRKYHYSLSGVTLYTEVLLQ